MFYYLNGQLTHLEANFAVLDVGGVGYKLTISGTTYDAMPANRSVSAPPTVKLFTDLAVREDGIELFGFATEEELDTFRLLISVSGVGPRAAMSVLSLLTPGKLAQAVCNEDQKAISKANGIGAKTAARIVLELKDKMQVSDSSADASVSAIPSLGAQSRGKLSEAVDALVVLGYTKADALNALKTIDLSAMSIEEIIRVSLKKLIR